MTRSVTRLESWLLCAASCLLAAPALAGGLQIGRNVCNTTTTCP